MKNCLTACLLFLTVNLFAQKVDLSQVWPAKWITTADGPQKEYAVHHFRKTFELTLIPEKLIVHTSGDNRYQLFVNGKMATLGPLRGDLRHWYYETTDIAQLLVKGKNVVAAVVLNYGSHPPDAQLSIQTGFVLASDDKQFDFLNTGQNWKAKHSTAYTPSMVNKEQVNGYYGGGSKEIIDGNKYIWDWNTLQYEDSDWPSAKIIENAYAKSCKWASRWKLMPRTLEHETLSMERMTQVRVLENAARAKEATTGEAIHIHIPRNTKAKIIIDQGYETTAYPNLIVSGGKNAHIKFTYVEAPYIDNPQKKNKGNRNEIEGKLFIGFFDKFISDGANNRHYTTLWWRAYRYIEVQVETFEEALEINDIYGIKSVFPFQQSAGIQLSGEEIDTGFVSKILEIGDRTLMACSHEHFMDCPYYEESQFEGDARVEMLVSYYNYGNPSLGKNAIEQFSWSINDEGFLSARYPTNSLYYIPNFSLYWIGMLHDYLMLYDDKAFLQRHIYTARSILGYYERNERLDGSVKKLDYHRFVDWTFKDGEAPVDANGYSALTDLHYLIALQWQAALEKEIGDTFHAQKYAGKAAKLKKLIKERYWNPALQLITDVPGTDASLSQHANCMAIITGVLNGAEAKKVMTQVLENKALIQATLYWQFYVSEALDAAGMGDRYIATLESRREIMDLGITTWPETGINSRSECHAWGSSPNYHIYKIMAGIKPYNVGFKTVLIEPKFGESDVMEIDFPHHAGKLSFSLTKKGNQLKGQISLPKGIGGILRYGGKDIKLREGKNEI